jgi:hypothetical protein
LFNINKVGTGAKISLMRKASNGSMRAVRMHTTNDEFQVFKISESESPHARKGWVPDPALMTYQMM